LGKFFSRRASSLLICIRMRRNDHWRYADLCPARKCGSVQRATDMEDAHTPDGTSLAAVSGRQTCSRSRLWSNPRHSLSIRQCCATSTTTRTIASVSIAIASRRCRTPIPLPRCRWGLQGAFASDAPRSETRKWERCVDDVQIGARDPLRDAAGHADCVGS
jgi:hypothetical protein